VNAGGPRDLGAPRRRGSDRRSGDAAAFDRWLSDGLAPDDQDRAAGRRLADAWRDRRRALDGGAVPGTGASARRRRVWWWAPLTVAAIAAVAVVAWPAPTVVDGDALANAYLEAMGALPMGAP
jgi:ferric-dicitrate binding protein FerR (iron transport regulator)